MTVSLYSAPTVCRTSYVHEAVVAAFEAGTLTRKQPRSAAEKVEALARIMSRHSA